MVASQSLLPSTYRSTRSKPFGEDGAFVVCRGRRTATTAHPASILVIMPSARASAPRVSADARARARAPLRAGCDVGGSAPRARPAPGPHLPRPRRSRRRAAGAKAGRRSRWSSGGSCGSASASRAALGALHRRGIMHKDLTPAHVMIDEATGRVWLTGFRIASRLRARAADAELARGDRGHAPLHGAGTDRPDEPIDRFAQRSLRARRHAVRNDHRNPAVLRRTRSDGMGALPHCPATDPAGRTRRRASRRWYPQSSCGCSRRRQRNATRQRPALNAISGAA